MKKRKIVAIIICFTFAISACGRTENKGENSISIAADTQQITNDANSADEMSFYDFEYDEMNNKLFLLDVDSNNVVEEISVNDTEVIDSYRRLTDGYAVIKSTYSDNMDNVEETNGIVFSTGTSEEKDSYKYIIYDDHLQEKEVIDLKGMISDELMSEIQECQSEPAIDPSGHNIAWSTESGIYVLNIKSGKQAFHEIESDGFSWYEIAFINENKVGFYRTSGDESVVTRYGYWNLTTDKLLYEDEFDYCPSLMRVSGEYLVLNDSEDPATHTSSGKVIIYDCEENQSNIFPVDNIESTFACITSDGKNLIAYNCVNSELTDHRIRVYQISNKQCISETPFSTESGVKFYDFCNMDKTYMLIGNGNSGKVIYHAFTAK